MAYPHPSHLLISVLLLCYNGGKCLVVQTSLGGDAVLPCDVGNITDPTIDHAAMAIFWSRTDLPPNQYVHFQRNGKELPDNKKFSYKGRTSLFQDEVKKGNMSLKLTRVKSSDGGIYTCNLPEIHKESTVLLTVALPQISVDDGKDVVLPCKTNFTVPVTEATVEWIRKDQTPPYVHVIRKGHELPLKNSVYEGRTSVSVEEFKNGDVSLKISGVTPSDRGIYTCFIRSEQEDECAVHLTVVEYYPWGMVIGIGFANGLVWCVMGFLYDRFCRRRNPTDNSRTTKVISEDRGVQSDIPLVASLPEETEEREKKKTQDQRFSRHDAFLSVSEVNPGQKVTEVTSRLYPHGDVFR